MKTKNALVFFIDNMVLGGTSFFKKINWLSSKVARKETVSFPIHFILNRAPWRAK